METSTNVSTSQKRPLFWVSVSAAVLGLLWLLRSNKNENIKSRETLENPMQRKSIEEMLAMAQKYADEGKLRHQFVEQHYPYYKYIKSSGNLKLFDQILPSKYEPITIDKVLKTAQQYADMGKNRTDFSKKFPQYLNYMLSTGNDDLLEEILPKKYSHITLEEALRIAYECHLKGMSRAEFRKEQQRIYQIIYKNGKINHIHKLFPPAYEVYDIETILLKAKEYADNGLSHAQFVKDNQKWFEFLRYRKQLHLLRQVLPKVFEVKLHRDQIIQLAIDEKNKGLSYSDIIKKNRNLYSAFSYHQMLDDLKKIFGVYKRKWTLTTALNEADKYDNLQDFIIADREKDSAYNFLMKKWEMQLLKEFYEEKAQGRRAYPNI